MPLASIDIGSNTVRLLIADVRNGKLVPIEYDQRITRLAEGLHRNGVLGEGPVASTLETLAVFKAKAVAHGVIRISAAGTGALREAENAGTFVQSARDGFGLDVDVLSGEDEAELTALGVTASLPLMHSALILDIGGGSTELVATAKRRVLARYSVPVGVVKLLEQHIRTDPPTLDELQSLRASAASTAGELAMTVLNLIENKAQFISTAGTPTTLAALDLGLTEYDHERVHGHRMSIERLEDMLSELSPLTVRQRVERGCIEPRRADLIIPGLILTIGIMKALGFHTMTVSDHGLLEGLLLRLAGVHPLV